MKRAGYRPYQGERTPEITHPMKGRGTHRACFIYHVINTVAVNSYEQGDSVRAAKYRKRNPSSFLPPLVYNDVAKRLYLYGVLACVVGM